MQTNCTPEQLLDPAVARSNKILRTCVHCGFCIATCPTYQLLGDELDSPRGRIYLIKGMLEAGRAADEKTVKHIDRCLSCLAALPAGAHMKKRFCGERCKNAAKQRRHRERNPEAVDRARKRYWTSLDLDGDDEPEP